jgi:hypothetical protein
MYLHERVLDPEAIRLRGAVDGVVVCVFGRVVCVTWYRQCRANPLMMVCASHSLGWNANSCATAAIHRE